ncbi:MAG: class SAM-dependent methyltransferase [Ilumatobacteraceae bacterium]|nr:class SAM-dependent methyltransferase [Ilumatobacteraceae bacterium]
MSDETRHAQRAASFASTAAAYERARPGYPQDLLDRVFAEVGIDRPRILDLGAGTGKLTRQLLAFGSVTAVEPLDAMRAQLEAVVPDATSLAGNAESIPLTDGSIDVVTVGQAYHWFDQAKANPEIWRVLADGGHLVALWNSQDETVPWLAAIDEIMNRDDPKESHPDRTKWWTSRFENEPWFTVPVLLTGSMTVSTTKQLMLDEMESRSYLSIRPPEDRQPILAEVAAVIAGFDDPFDVPYETEAYWCRKLPHTAS